ncbi:MAG: hypothetical protein ACRDNO_30590 [Trebonia sp.]
MGWQPGPLAGFAHGGKWDAAPPSAVLAAALETAAGPVGLYDAADTDALVGTVRQWAAIESWAAAQSPGWAVTQPKPGWHAWTTPTGRTYVQPPWRYTA